MGVKNRQVRIFQPGNYLPGETLRLDAEAAHHTVVVLRLTIGQPLVLFNGDNCVYAATITAITRKEVTVQIDSAELMDKESSCQIHLAQALVKDDRMEWIIQKAVELGVTGIVPLSSERCSVKLSNDALQKKYRQWRRIIISACEQCGRNTIPGIQDVQGLINFIKKPSAVDNYMLHPGGSASWRNYRFSTNIGLLIGPEGGFSDNEVMSLHAHGCKPLMLGSRVLRAETAAVAAISILQAQAGDL